MDTHRLIGELLIDGSVITESQLEVALTLQKTQSGRICQILMSLGYLTEVDLLACLELQVEEPPIPMDPFIVSPALMAFVPRDVAIEHEAMPLDRTGERLTLALGGPQNPSTPAIIAEHSGLSVRDVLCRREIVQAAIAQYYSAIRVDGTMANLKPGPEAVRLKNLVGIIDTLDQFPLLPEAHLQLLACLEDPDVALADVPPLIERDPTLSANILKMANSAAYATREGFDGVRRAAIFLGQRRLRSMVLAAGVFEGLSRRATFDLTTMFAQSYRCGVLTQIICEVASIGDPDAAFTAGLLADIGRIALRIFSPEYAEQIERRTRQDDEDAAYVQRADVHVQAEESLLGVAASELGYHLARHWGMPETLASTIRFHDRLDRTPTPPPLTLAVALAEYCLTSLDNTGAFGDPESEPELARLLGATNQNWGVLAEIAGRYLAVVPDGSEAEVSAT